MDPNLFVVERRMMDQMSENPEPAAVHLNLLDSLCLSYQTAVKEPSAVGMDWSSFPSQTTAEPGPGAVRLNLVLVWKRVMVPVVPVPVLVLARWNNSVHRYFHSSELKEFS